MKKEPEKLIIDAQGVSFGRLASKLAVLLMGKDKPDYQPHLEDNRLIEVINIKEVKITGKKRENKIYYRHTGYPGGIRKTKFSKLIDETPEKAVKKAVYNMLPVNKLRKKSLKRLTIK